MATVKFKHVVFFKRTFIHEHINTLASCIFTSCMLFLDGFFAATKFCTFTFCDKLFNFLYLFAHKIYLFI